MGQRHRAGSCAEEVRATGFEEVGVDTHDLPESAPEAVADDRVPGRTPDRVRHCGWGRVGAAQHTDRDGTRAVATGPGEGTEGLTAADASDQAESLARPWRRRPLITARPARVRIRRRKPCFFLRFRLLG
jgi:hypothetical protein